MHIIRILKITEESNFNTIVCTVKTCQKEGRGVSFLSFLYSRASLTPRRRSSTLLQLNNQRSADRSRLVHGIYSWTFFFLLLAD